MQTDKMPSTAVSVSSLAFCHRLVFTSHLQRPLCKYRNSCYFVGISKLSLLQDSADIPTCCPPVTGALSQFVSLFGRHLVSKTYAFCTFATMNQIVKKTNKTNNPILFAVKTKTINVFYSFIHNLTHNNIYYKLFSPKICMIGRVGRIGFVLFLHNLMHNKIK
jgi:hypothetical protein